MRTWMVSALAACLIWTAAPSAQAPASGPDPDLGPMQVVEAMISAMKKGSDEGIAELYAFASPKNREQVGSLADFTRMMREYFPDMLGHERARAAPPLVDQGRAMIPVELVTQDGGVSEYVIILSVQEGGPCEGCWMTDAVVPPEALEGMSPGQPQGRPGEGGA